MSWKITYTDKWSGEKRTHVHSNNEAGAKGWGSTLSTEHGSKAVVEHVADGPYDNSGKVTHVVSYGDSKRK